MKPAVHQRIGNPMSHTKFHQNRTMGTQKNPKLSQLEGSWTSLFFTKSSFRQPEKIWLAKIIKILQKNEVQKDFGLSIAAIAELCRRLCLVSKINILITQLVFNNIRHENIYILVKKHDCARKMLDPTNIVLVPTSKLEIGVCHHRKYSYICLCKRNSKMKKRYVTNNILSQNLHVSQMLKWNIDRTLSYVMKYVSK